MASRRTSALLSFLLLLLISFRGSSLQEIEDNEFWDSFFADERVIPELKVQTKRSDVILLSFEVSSTSVAPFVHPSLRVDTFEDKAYITALISDLNEKTWTMSTPALSSLEFQLITFVNLETGDGTFERGMWPISTEYHKWSSFELHSLLNYATLCFWSDFSRTTSIQADGTVSQEISLKRKGGIGSASFSFVELDEIHSEDFSSNTLLQWMLGFDRNSIFSSKNGILYKTLTRDRSVSNIKNGEMKSWKINTPQFKEIFPISNPDPSHVFYISEITEDFTVPPQPIEHPLTLTETPLQKSDDSTKSVSVLRPTPNFEAVERSVVIIKPDGVQRRIAFDVLNRFEQKGFKLIDLKMVQASEEKMRLHYEHLKEKPFFGSLINFMTSGPIIISVWEGERVVEFARRMVGSTDPLDAAPGTIRADFAFEKERNVIHVSESTEEAKREYILWFS